MSDHDEQQPLLPVRHDDQRPTESKPPGTYRERTAIFLDSPSLHKTVITLITIDAACVLADLGYTFLSPGCTPIGPEAPLWLDVLSYISLAITTFFLVEIPLSLWAFGSRYYDPWNGVPHASLHLFDAVIIVTTFILEVVLRGRERELASLLIILRLWRLVKLVGGVAVGAGELEEENAKRLAETLEELEETKTKLSLVQDENREFRRRLTVLEGRREAPEEMSEA